MAAGANAEVDKWVCIDKLEIRASDFYGGMTDDGSMLTVSVLDRVAVADATEPVKFEAVVTEPGSLAAVVGDRLTEIDEIAVSGPINDADFSTLWLASFEGRLRIVDLTDASVDGGVVPDDAFYHQGAQMDPKTHEIKTIALEKLYLPDGVTELGASVALHCANLTEVRLPSTLEIIGRNAFGWCKALTFDRLVFPETLEIIASNAFSHTEALSCEVVFPKSLNEIGSEAFAYSSLIGATFTDAVKNIGRRAFASSGLRKLSLHEGCGFDEQIGSQFTDNRNLVEVTLPPDLTTIPYSMFSFCTALERVELPVALESVGEQAFCMTAIENLSLPEGVKTLEANSFSDCANLIEVTLPSTVQSIAGSAFLGCKAIKTIFSLIENPTPENSMYSTSYHDAVVYIPTGTGMAYRNTEGWKGFRYFVEVTDGALHYESFKAVTNDADNALAAVNFTFHDAVSVVDGGVVQLWDNDMLSLVKEVPAYVNTLVNCFMVSADFGGVELVADKHYSIVMPEGTVVDAIGHAVSNSRYVVALDVNSGIEAVVAAVNASVTVTGGVIAVESARNGADVMVVAADGKVVARTKAMAGSASFRLPVGIYIVVIDGCASRVAVR